MSGPTLDEFGELDGERVRVTVPKPREDQRLVGVVECDGPAVTLAVEAASGDHATVVLRERERDGVVRAFRGADGETLVGRVKRVETVEK
ncbi:hypothetical protein HWV07_00065 [Natronomonas salina]|uniref:hypothetical protein n=1 Tax=Natronomonas salina TaxID=1710540 RepID=UPI0015B61FB6|nr:hypothetical protein [Natronomonas salina]QLD87514.1 hypothetical protein HWV07_00065 [Natronomonas salina]